MESDDHANRHTELSSVKPSIMRLDDVQLYRELTMLMTTPMVSEC